VTLVRREQRQILFETNRSNQNILDANLLIAADQIIMQTSSAARGDFIEWKNNHQSKQRLLSDLLLSARNAKQQFVHGDRGDVTGRLFDRALHRRCARLTSLEIRDEYACV
jgi:hypothetical protein